MGSDTSPLPTMQKCKHFHKRMFIECLCLYNNHNDTFVNKKNKIRQKDSKPPCPLTFRGEKKLGVRTPQVLRTTVCHFRAPRRAKKLLEPESTRIYIVVGRGYSAFAKNRWVGKGIGEWGYRQKL